MIKQILEGLFPELDLSTIQFPGRRSEEWRGISPRDLLGKEPLIRVDQEGIRVPCEASGENKRNSIVFYNGLFAKELSHLPKGVSVNTSKEEVSRSSQNLNQALFHDAPHYSIIVPMDVDALHIKHIIQSKHARIFVGCRVHVNIAGKGNVKIHEEVIIKEGTQGVFANGMEYDVGNEACLHLAQELEGRPSCTIFSDVVTTFHPHAEMYHNIHCHGGIVKGVNTAELVDHTTYTLHGRFSGDGGDKHMYQTNVKHRSKESTSTQKFRILGDGKAHQIVDSEVYIGKEAKGTQAHQDLKALHLSDTTRVELVPRLEVYCDDVKCSHGATIGHLDKATLVYLAARGVGIDKAKVMLAKAFLEA